MNGNYLEELSKVIRETNHSFCDLSLKYHDEIGFAYSSEDELEIVIWFDPCKSENVIEAEIVDEDGVTIHYEEIPFELTFDLKKDITNYMICAELHIPRLKKIHIDLINSTSSK